MPSLRNNHPFAAFDLLTGIGYVSVLAVIGVILFNLGNGTELILQKYMGDDSFFYLVIARNISESGFSSFDGLHFTNGYHPLWQLLVSGLAFVIQDDMTLLLATILLGIALSTISLLLLHLLLGKMGVSRQWTAVSILLGVFFLLLPSWYGLESFLATSLLLGSLYYYFNGYDETAARSQCILGLLFSLTVLARLDAIFPVFFFFLSRLLQIGRRDPGKLMALVYLGGFFSVPILVYLGFNFLNTGHLMPISGALKSSFPEITPSNIPLRPEYLVRVAPPVLSSLVVVSILSWRYMARRHAEPHFIRVLLFLNLGVLCFGLYEFLFQQDAMWGLRPWHFALPNAVMLLSLGPAIFRHLPDRLPALIIPFLVLFNLFALNQKFLTDTATNPVKSDLYATAEWVRQNTRKDEVLAVTDPGVIAFIGGRKTISLDGLANNHGYQEVLEEKALQSYLNENGVGYIGIFARGHDINRSTNEIRIEARLSGGFDTLVLSEDNRVYTSPNGFYSLWRNEAR